MAYWAIFGKGLRRRLHFVALSSNFGWMVRKYLLLLFVITDSA